YENLQAFNTNLLNQLNGGGGGGGMGGGGICSGLGLKPND
ncbi:hypothetical protein A2U01_0094836, partial [Trifolium medium]|nr:hypothetical protein [Trifolium medium]